MSDARLLDVGTENYHADRLGAPEPTLSSGRIRDLLVSPAHGKASMATDTVDPPQKNRDFGSLVHDMLLRQPLQRYAVATGIEGRGAKGWKRFRQEAEDDGKTPLLADEYNAAVEIANAVHGQLAEHEIGQDWLEGRTEQTVVWYQGNIWNRARLDAAPFEHHGRLLVPDIKTTGLLARDWYLAMMRAKRVDLQARHYVDAVEALTGHPRVAFVWIVVEQEPPHGLQVIECPQELLQTTTRRDVDRARRLWRLGLDAGTWPTLYPTEIVRPGVPEWLESRLLAAEEDGPDPADFKAAIAAQQPMEEPA